MRHQDRGAYLRATNTTATMPALIARTSTTSSGLMGCPRCADLCPVASRQAAAKPGVKDSGLCTGGGGLLAGPAAAKLSANKFGDVRNAHGFPQVIGLLTYRGKR
jgi:hypothetical protein